MNESKYLSNRLREVLLNGQWIANTNWRQQLLETNWKDSEVKFENLNSIADITFHVNYYINGVIPALEGGTLDIRDKYSFDRESVKSEHDWLSITSKFIENSNHICDIINDLSPKKLGSIFVDEKYGTYKRNIDGLIEHAYYHLAQVVQIRKIISYQPKTVPKESR